MTEWVLVPREASEAMIRAGYSAPTVFGVRDMANTYRAMLAAAPDAPQRNREADRARYIDRAFNEWLDDSVADGGATVWDLVSDVHSAWAAWTAHPHYAAPAAPQQVEPVAQIGWADEFGNLFPMGAWKPAQRTWRDSHKTAWRPVFLHPPAAEVQRLRDALTAICAVADDREEGNYDTVPIHFIRSIARDATKGGK